MHVLSWRMWELCQHICSSLFSPPIDNFDVFKEGKAQNFFESQEAIIALCTYFQELLKNIKDLDEKQLQEELFKLLQVNW